MGIGWPGRRDIPEGGAEEKEDIRKDGALRSLSVLCPPDSRSFTPNVKFKLAQFFLTLRLAPLSDHGLPPRPHLYSSYVFSFSPLTPLFDSFPGFHVSARRSALARFNMPAMSPTMTEGGISAWKKKEGESFASGDVLLEIVRVNPVHPNLQC
jgi:hypothetical protein